MELRKPDARIGQMIGNHVFNYGRWIQVVIGLVTLGMLFGLPKVTLETRFSDLLPGDHEYVQVFKDYPSFGSPLTVTLVVENLEGSIFTAETLAKVWRLSREIDLVPGVDHDMVLSVATEKARYSYATPWGVETHPLMDNRPPETLEEIETFKGRLQGSPYASKFLVSQDGATTLVQATFIESKLDYAEVFDRVMTLAEAESDEAHRIQVAGQPILTGWVYSHEGAMVLLLGLTLLLFLIAKCLFLRSWVGIMVPFSCSLLAAVWGFGFIGWLGIPIDPLMMVVPVLLIARSFSHCVQFVSRYLEFLSENPDRKNASRETLQAMWAPSFLGIVTDAAGLFLIGLIPIVALQNSAVLFGFWAAMLVPTNVIMAAILVGYFPIPKKLLNKANRPTAGQFGLTASKAFLKGVAAVSCSRFRGLSLALLLIMAGWAFNTGLELKVGNPSKGSSLLYEDSDYNQAVAEVNQRYPGMETLELIVEGQAIEGATRPLRRTETLEQLQSLQRYIEALPSPPRATLSFADYLREPVRLFNGGHPKWLPLDHTSEATSAAVTASMMGSSPKAFLHVSDFTQTNGTLTLWYPNNTPETLDRVRQHLQAIENYVSLHPTEGFRWRLAGGSIALQVAISDTLVSYELEILLFLNLVMLITCSLAYRSVWAGLLLLLPVNLANLLLKTVMVYMDLGLDVNTLPVTAIGIGVGIDYGIYLLSRIKEEAAVQADLSVAISDAIQTTGRSIFFTACIVMLGVCPWYLLSELKFVADMGLLLMLVMMINMFTALIFLPLLVRYLGPYFLNQPSCSPEGEFDYAQNKI